MAEDKDRLQKQNARKDQQEPVASPDAGITGRLTPSDPGSSETYLGQQGMNAGGLNEPTSGGEREVSGNVAPSTGTRMVSQGRRGNHMSEQEEEAIIDDPKTTGYGGPDSDLPPGESVYTDSTSSGSDTQQGNRTDAKENVHPSGNQSVNPNTGGTRNTSGKPMESMNPSAPNTGTSDNSPMAHGSNPTATNPGTEGAGDVRGKQSFMPGASSQEGQSTKQGSGRFEFRCADVGQTECPFTLRGNSPEEMLPNIQQHASEAHNLELKDQAIQHVRQAIHEVKEAA